MMDQIQPKTHHIISIHYFQRMTTANKEKGAGVSMGWHVGGAAHWPAYIMFGCVCMHCFHTPATD
jgi:hypothetical protein